MPKQHHQRRASLERQGIYGDVFLLVQKLVDDALWIRCEITVEIQWEAVVRVPGVVKARRLVIPTGLKICCLAWQ